MTDPVDRLRAVALQLPEAGEDDGRFVVAGKVFAAWDEGGVQVRTRDDGWRTLPVDDATDWRAIEDAVAESWELTAPDRLLEAGGR